MADLRTLEEPLVKALVTYISRATTAHAEGVLIEIAGLDPRFKNEIHAEAAREFLRYRLEVAKAYSEQNRLNEVVDAHYSNSYIILPSKSIKALFAQDPERAAKLWRQHVESLLALPFSTATKFLILNEMIFDSNLQYLVPENILTDLQEHFSEQRIRLASDSFINKLDKSDPEALGSDLLDFVKREKIDPIPGWLLAEVLSRFEAKLRKDDILIFNYDLLFHLKNPLLWPKLKGSDRPNLKDLWAYFGKLPKQRVAGSTYSMNFDLLYALFAPVIPEYEIFQAFLDHRFLLRFSEKVGVPEARIRGRFFDFARRHRPHDAELFANILTTHRQQQTLLREQRAIVVRETIAESFKRSRNEPLEEQIYQAGKDVYDRYYQQWGEEISGIINSPSVGWLPQEKVSRLRAVLVFLEVGQQIGAYTNAFVPSSLYPKDKDFEGLPLEMLFEYWRKFSRAQTYLEKGSTDRVFNFIWKNIGNNQELLKKFTFPELVPHLVYDDEKVKLATWQLNWFMTQQYPRATRSGLRAIVKSVFKFIETQFPYSSALRDRMLGLVEDRLLTNMEETEFLKTLRQTPDSPKASPSTLLVDSVHIYARNAKSNFEKYELMLFLVGRDYSPPAGMSMDTATAMKRVFLNSEESVRAYTLQALLDKETGILSDEPLKERLFQFMLGNNANEKVVRAIFMNYLQAVPESESVVLLTHGLASMASTGGGRMLVRTMLELMGPLGIKVGQYLKTTGLVGSEIRKELEGFLDRALAPVRYQIFDRLREIFGDELKDIELVEELLGSGSINYVVKAKMDGEEVGIRLLKQEAAGQIANEDEVWRKTIAAMIQTGDKEIMQWAGVLDEARAHSMRTLSVDGDEFNLELERENYGKAKAVYVSAVDPVSGYAVTTIQPNFRLQGLVPEKYRKVVTVLPYIQSTPLKRIEKNLRAKLAQAIVAAELRAIFELGVFDPDGHPGNWLVDSRAKDLVRIDYAQMHSLEPAKRQLIRQVLKLMVQPNFSQRDIGLLASALPLIFTGDLADADIAHHVSLILCEKEFPRYDQPQERLLYLREALELRTGRQIRFEQDLRIVMSAIGRLAGFREFMSSPREFNQLFLRALGTSRPQLILQAARVAVSSFKEDCRRLLIRSR